MRFPYRVAAAAIIAAMAGCNDGTKPLVPTPPAGAVVSLITPRTDDGAVVVTLTGPQLSGIQMSTRYVVYSRLVNPQEARIIVIGDLVAGPLFRVTFASPPSLPAYSGFIEQVATRGDSILESTAGYQLSIAETSPTARQP
jgi:hypothetical protein